MTYILVAIITFGSFNVEMHKTVESEEACYAAGAQFSMMMSYYSTMHPEFKPQEIAIGCKPATLETAA